VTGFERLLRDLKAEKTPPPAWVMRTREDMRAKATGRPHAILARNTGISRRALLMAGTGVLFAAHTEYLSAADAAEIEAIASAIIPSDETPGAKEAGVMYFIDRALTTFAHDQRGLYLSGLAAAQAKRREMFPESASIAALTPAQLSDLVRSIEKTPFFEAVRTHTITGFLATPEWGGNRGKVGWKAIGFEDAFAYQPPFGYYDRPENLK
jgi:gluconate 2-dehydrogenase gamma chain